MTQTITYHSINAPAGQEWMAYVVLPNWQKWGVYASASTEEEAIRKIVALYESEYAKLKDIKDKAEASVKNILNNSKGTLINQHHLAGKVWLIHKETRDKSRVSEAEANVMLNSGMYERGGPRSK